MNSHSSVTHCKCGETISQPPNRRGQRRIYCDVCAKKATLEAVRRYQTRNHAKKLRDIRQWRLENPEKVRVCRNKNFHKAYHTNPSFRLATLCRNRLRRWLKKNPKAANTESLLGCSFKFLKIHIESQFRPGMTWENHGPVWEVDHIKPCASFDCSDLDQQKKCFHYSNLQPLFVVENREKRDS